MRLAVLTAALAASSALALAASVAAARAEPVPVVATFSILGDMVREIGGERVEVMTLVGPDGDAHVYQPTPADARRIRQARLVVENGLGFEGWIDRLIEASGYDGPVAVASRGVTPLGFGESAADESAHSHAESAHGEAHAHAEAADAHGEEAHAHAEVAHAHAQEAHAHAEEAHGHSEDAHSEDAHAEAGHEHAHGHAEERVQAHADEASGGHADHDHGDVDPHAWQSLANGRIYVANIADALAAIDPDGAETYAANRDSYLAEIAALEAELAGRLASVPADRRSVVTSHDAFGYLAAATGIRFVSPVGASTESDVSAQDVAAIIRQIREEGIRAVFIENVSDPRLVDRIAAETGASVGGTLFSDALSGPDGAAPTYLDMMRHNVEALTAALGA